MRTSSKLCLDVTGECALGYANGIVTAPNLSVRLGVLMRGTSRAASIALAAVISFGPARAETPLTAPLHNLVQIRQISGGLALTVIDGTGAAFPKARVTILNERTKARVNGETDVNGQLLLSDLPNGEYEITVGSPGFQPFTQSHVSVVGPDPEKLKLQLQVGFVGEVVAVNRPNGFRRFVSKLRHLF
jgi:hypothetical protein